MSRLTDAMHVLRAFSTRDREISVTGIAEKLQAPKSTVSRLLKEMREQDLLWQDPESKKYRPGFFLYHLGQLYEEHLQLFPLVLAEVERLVRLTGHTGYIGLLDGPDTLSLRSIQGVHPIKYVVNAGRRLPAHASSFGRCLLARMSDDEVTRLYPGPWTHDYAKAPSSLDQLLRQLATVRDCGWAEAEVSTLPGVKAVGVSITSPSGTEGYGYSLSFPQASLSKADVKKLAAIMVASTQSLAARIGLQPT